MPEVTDVRVLRQTRDDGTSKYIVVLPSDCTSEGAGVSCVAVVMPENVKRTEISDMQVTEVSLVCE